MSVRNITQDEVTSFKNNGWVYLPRLVDPAVAAHLHKQGMDAMGPEHGRTIGDFGELSDQTFTVLVGEDRQTPFTRDVVLAPTMGSNITRLLNVPEVLLLWDRYLIKGPQTGGEHTETIFHQDYPGNFLDRSNFMTVWVALHDMEAPAGTMQFYNGSHRRGVFGNAFSDGIDLRKRLPELQELELSPPLNMRAGDATAHHCLVVHGAPANTTRDHRCAYIMTYSDSEARYNCSPAGVLPPGVKLEPFSHFDHPSFPRLPVA